MRVSDFDFELPEELIALRPARPRDSARLLHVCAAGGLHDRAVLDLPAILRPGDLLVLNDTRVIPAALTGRRPARAEGGGGDAKITVNLHRREAPDAWRAFVKPAKRLRVGDRVVFGGVEAQVKGKEEGGEALLLFDRAGAALDAAIRAAGAPPLPPYIAGRRAPDAGDASDYQTVFADREGSVAAPTAGLHFTERLFAALAESGVRTARVTLHVGAGTFLPVKGEDTADHRMHAEWFELGEAAAQAVNAARAEGRRVIPVGTTALRTLESCADAAGRVQARAGETDIFITPGYRFRVTDALLTNFHLPRSTLFMLVSALAGLAVMKRAYVHAIENKYRFYSYGDACLIEKAGTPGA
ncbi:MAG: tRNA preQ1(34) S-adenosylmethionine ribosyltransferase-isomerase QueA [Maricaulaceae bacterium]|nr:tRNA preQ1(34) S-adenosylmethionine ribosyltransferase-isomerase QueA [Maricaulaceae bacterium]